MRDRMMLFWTLLFPSAMLFVFTYAFATRDASGKLTKESILEQLSNIMVLSLVSNGLFSAGVFIAQDRAMGVLRRFYVSGLNAKTLLLAVFIRQIVLAALSSTILVAIATMIAGESLALPWLTYSATIALGAISYGGLGLFVASVARTPEIAGMLANVIYFPSIFLSGATFPVDALPAPLRAIKWALPGFYLRDLFYYVNGYIDGSIMWWLSVLILGVIAIVGYAVSSVIFKWQ